MTHLEDPLKDYPVVTQLPILWGHMDAFQHVNNVIYFRYFESARIVYGERINLYDFMKETGTGPIIAATSCNYLRPLVYPDTIRIGTRTIRITESEMEQEYGIFSERLQRLAAVGTAKIVAYDYHKFQRSAFPRPLIERVLQLEKNLQVS